MSLCGKGVDIDGAERDGEGVTCSVDYFCDYFKDEIEEEEQTKRKQDSKLQGLKPVAKVTGNQKIINGSPLTTPTTQSRQRVVKKKVDDGVHVKKQQQQQQQQPKHRTETKIQINKDATNNNNAQVRKKKEL